MIADAFKVFVVCDQHDRSMAVTNFIYAGSEAAALDPETRDEYFVAGWNRVGVRTAGRGLAGDRNVPLVGNEPYDFARHGTARAARYTYQLKCRRCPGVVAARSEKLFAALTRLAEDGVSVVSLRGLSAIL